MSIEAMKRWVGALELAQDNLRDHGDNCFLHDEGEYNRCFCGKDSLSNHLQSCVEELDQAIEQSQKQEPVAWLVDNDYTTVWFDIAELHRKKGAYVVPLYTTPQPRQPLTDEREAVAEIARLHDVIKNLKYDLEFLTQQSVKPLTDDDKWKLWLDARSNVLQFARAIEAAHGIGEKK